MLSVMYSFPHPSYPYPSLSILGLHIFLSALFSNTLSLCSTLDVTDHVSHLLNNGKNYSSKNPDLCIFG